MKIIITLLTFFTASTMAIAGPVETFQSLCMGNIGNPAKIEAAAKKAGFKMTSLAPNSAMGMRRATDESIQINAFTKHKFECAVTTSKGNSATLRESFFQSIGAKHKRGVATGKINNVKYTFLHDPKGGEAFVVFSD